MQPRESRRVAGAYLCLPLRRWHCERALALMNWLLILEVRTQVHEIHKRLGTLCIHSFAKRTNITYYYFRCLLCLAPFARSPNKKKINCMGINGREASVNSWMEYPRIAADSQKQFEIEIQYFCMLIDHFNWLGGFSIGMRDANAERALDARSVRQRVMVRELAKVFVKYVVERSVIECDLTSGGEEMLCVRKSFLHSTRCHFGVFLFSLLLCVRLNLETIQTRFMNVRGLWAWKMLAAMVATPPFIRFWWIFIARHYDVRSELQPPYHCEWCFRLQLNLLGDAWVLLVSTQPKSIKRFVFFPTYSECFYSLAIRSCGNDGENKGEANCDIDSEFKCDAIFLNWRKWLRLRKSKRNLILFGPFVLWIQ